MIQQKKSSACHKIKEQKIILQEDLDKEETRMVRLDDALHSYQELIVEMSHKVRNMHILSLEVLEDGV